MTQNLKWSEILQKLCGGSGKAGLGDEIDTQNVVVQIDDKPKPPLHALIIGIDDYSSSDIKKLSGAVNDAKAFRDYLVQDLSVPADNVSTLFDSQATRAGIISAFQALCKDENIAFGDPIVIYYSGHGAEIKPPPDRAVNGPLVQCIIPQDASTRAEARVCPIPDFTIGALVEEIAAAKGDNITLVFDCCHSAGGSRDGDDDGARFIEMDSVCELPASVDSEILDQAASKSAKAELPVGFAKQAMETHVLIAACAHGERAYENVDTKRGYFTTALLDLLRRVKIDNLTYKGCMQRLPTLDTKGNPQNPVCEGRNINRSFFNARVAADSSFILVKKTGSNLTLQAGVVEGVTVGCVFEIHESHVLGPNNPPLGKLVVQSSEAFQATLRYVDETAPFTVPDLAYGRQIGYGSEQALDVHFTDDFVNSAIPSKQWGSLFSGGSRSIAIRPADQAVAQLTVGISDDRKHATFTISQQAAVKYNLHHLVPPKPIPAEAKFVLPVLRAIALWTWHLRRTNGDHPFQPAVEVEFYKLKDVGTGKQGKRIFEPTGENLNIGGEARVVVKKGARFGFKITNNSTRDLYAYPLYFSVPEQSIIPTYNNVCGNGKVDPSLPRDKTPNDPTQPKWNYVTVGYGSGGVDALRYELPAGQDLDVGIYKIFLTTEPADFSSLELHSPLEWTRALARETDIRDSLGDIPMWDTISLTVVQYREGTQPWGEQGENPTRSVVETPSSFNLPCTDKVRVQADSPSVKLHSWFTSEPLTQEQLSKASHLKLRTRSKETPPLKGSASVLAQVECTWFQLSILGEGDMLKCPEEGEEEAEESEPYRWRSHFNQRGADLDWVEGLDFDRTHEIWKHLEVGDKIQVEVAAKYRGWANNAEEATLSMW